MGTAKRERQKQGRYERLEAARAADQRSRRLRTIRNWGLAIVVLIAAAFLLSTQFGDDDKADVATSTDSSTTTSTLPGETTLPANQVPINAPAAGASVTGDTSCPPADGTAARTTTFEKAPPTCIDPAKTYTAKVDTSKGSFTFALEPNAAPLAVNNFVVLARYHYYDGVPFHRIITGFMNQGGDATGPVLGGGGPGYSFADELPADKSVYTEGAVAMANSGPNTNGSQFFVVVGSGGQGLEPLYTKFGQVTSGIEVVQAINQLATTNPQGQNPTGPEVVTITGVTITES